MGHAPPAPPATRARAQRPRKRVIQLSSVTRRVAPGLTRRGVGRPCRPRPERHRASCLRWCRRPTVGNVVYDEASLAATRAAGRSAASRRHAAVEGSQHPADHLHRHPRHAHQPLAGQPADIQTSTGTSARHRAPQPVWAVKRRGELRRLAAPPLTRTRAGDAPEGPWSPTATSPARDNCPAEHAPGASSAVPDR